MLDGILSRAGKLEAVAATEGARLRDGRIYVAPADHHLIVEPGVLRLTKGPRENRFRPAIDPLFHSAAQVYGPAAIGVILTGSLDDGSAGLWAVKQLGGVAIVQDPTDALFASMPSNALQHVAVDFVVPLQQIAPLLVDVVASPITGRGDTPPISMEVEVNIAKGQNAVSAGIEQVGEPSPFACPECHGVLLRVKGSQPLRFRCHTGHAYSASSLVAAINEGVEDALWTAVRALEEGALLMNHLSNHGEGPPANAASSLTKQAAEAHRHSEAIRRVLSLREALRAVHD